MNLEIFLQILEKASDDILIVVFFFIILGFVVVDRVFSKDFKATIISIGVLGTFLGIVLGLYNFNTSDTTKSVSNLLEGLKLAFVTSILGMFFSTLLAVIDAFRKKPSSDDTTTTEALLRSIFNSSKETNKNIHFYLHAINESLHKVLGFLSRGATKEEIITILEKVTSDFNQNLTEQFGSNFKQLNESVKKMEDTTKSLLQSILHSLKEADTNARSRFNEINESLKKALDALSRGAKEEVIEALKKVISDFNKNLTEQFGDNFKQLNESVKKMVEWQENYKAAIAQTEKNLHLVITNLETNAKYSEELTRKYKEMFKTTNQDLSKIIQTNQNQIQNLETHMKSLKKIGDDAHLIVQSINDFSKTIQDSLSGQSKGLERLKDNLVKQLESALGNLNQTLTGLTDKFRKDYEEYLKHFGQLLEKLPKDQ